MITPVGQIKSDNDDVMLKMWQVNVDPAMRLLREHRHINFEIAMVIGGSGVYHTGSGVHTMQTGDVFVFSSNEPHCITEIKQPGLELLNLHFNHHFFSNAGSLNSRYPNIFFSHAKTFCNKIPFEKSKTICRYLYTIKDELESAGQEYVSGIESMLSLIFVELIRNHLYYVPQENNARDTIAKILRGVQYIDSNFHLDITLKEIAAESGISPNYFTRLFKECFDINLWDYIAAKRIDHAKKLITASDNNDTILNIALSCGFNNTANFNRTFKKHTGMTPTEYKNAKSHLLH